MFYSFRSLPVTVLIETTQREKERLGGGGLLATSCVNMHTHSHVFLLNMKLINRPKWTLCSLRTREMYDITKLSNDCELGA